MNKKLTLEQVTLDKVKESEYGCRNCLWCGIECKQYANFKPRLVENKIASCEGYNYYN